MRLNFSLNNKIEAYQKAFVSDLRLGHADRTPDGVRSSLAGIPVGGLLRADPAPLPQKCHNIYK